MADRDISGGARPGEQIQEAFADAQPPSRFRLRFCWRCVWTTLALLIGIGGVGWLASQQIEAARAAEALRYSELLEEVEDLDASNIRLQADLERMEDQLAAARAAALASPGGGVDEITARAQALTEEERRALGVALLGEQGRTALDARRNLARLPLDERAGLFAGLPDLAIFTAWFESLDREARLDWVRRLPGLSDVGPTKIDAPGGGAVEPGPELREARALIEKASLETRNAEAEVERSLLALKEVREAREAADARAEKATLAAQQSRETVNEQAQRITALEDALAQERAKAQGSESAATDLREKLASAEKKLKRATQARNEATAEIDQLKARHDAARKQAQDAEARAKVAREELAKLRAETRATPGVATVGETGQYAASIETGPVAADRASQESPASAENAASGGAGVEPTGGGSTASPPSETERALSVRLEESEAARAAFKEALQAEEEKTASVERALASAEAEAASARSEAALLGARLDGALAKIEAATLQARASDDKAAELETLIGSERRRAEALLRDLNEARAEAAVARKRLAEERTRASARSEAVEPRQNAEREGAAAEARETEAVETTAAALRTAIGGDGAGEALSARLSFRSGSAELSRSAEARLDRFADALMARMNASAPTGWRLIVTGHTDQVPINTRAFRSNWALSAQRAAAVVRRLEERGVPGDRLYAVGRAEKDPVDPANSRAAFAKNRRIEFRLLQAGG